MSRLDGEVPRATLLVVAVAPVVLFSFCVSFLHLFRLACEVLAVHFQGSTENVERLAVNLKLRITQMGNDVIVCSWCGITFLILPSRVTV